MLYKTDTCVPQRKQIIVSRLNPDLSSLKITAYIRYKVQIDDIKDYRFNYAKEVSSFKIGVHCAHLATTCSANFWPVGIIVNEYESKKNKVRLREIHLHEKPKFFYSAFLSEYTS